MIVLGDFNAGIGKISHDSSPQIIGKYSYHQNTNDDGELLVSLCENIKLISAFYRQPHKNNHMWTWEHPDDIHKAQVDHILLGGKWRNSIRKCRAYSTVDLDSDHRIVTANLKISLRVCRVVQRDIQELSSSADLQ